MLRPTATRPARLLGALIGALLAGACGGDDPKAARDDTPREPRVMVRLSFDEIVCVEPGASTWKQIERIREGKKSILPALEKAGITLPVRKQIEIDLPSVKKERVAVIDPATGTKRSALRLRYQFVAAALVPKELATKGSLRLGMLHAVDRARAEAVITACTPADDRERAHAPGVDLASFFDPSLPSCQEAIAAEASAIASAREKLEHPDKEIVPAELSRSYLPVTVQIDIHHAPPRLAAPAAFVAAAPAAPQAAPAFEGPAAVPAPPSFEAPAAPAAPAVPARVALIGEATPAAPAYQAAPAYAAPPQPRAFAPAPAPAAPGPPPDQVDVMTQQVLAVKNPDQDLAADEAELAQQDHHAAVMAGVEPPPVAEPAGSDVAPAVFIPGGTPTYLQPNFAMLYVALGVGGLILFGKRRSKR